MSRPCWSCGSSQIEPIFEVSELVLSSLVLMETAQAARAFPRGGLELAVCTRCSFIFNLRFDPGQVDYTMPYESSQIFSPRFRRFADELIDHLVTTYQLEGAEILEIGCGDASFLQELARRAGAKGVGIDPTFDQARIAPEVNVAGIAELYGPDHTHLSADLICCRHTLEHIQPVGDFVDWVRESAEQRPGAVVFFEVPDTERILDEGAFWDTYNEHCSYFTLPSLSYLFRSRGFQLLRLAKGFDDQYLLVEARPGERDASDQPEAVAAVVHKARRFGRTARAEIHAWRELVEEASSDGVVVLWGASSKAVAFLAAIDRDHLVSAAVDINPLKQDMYLPGSGTPVVSPERLVDLDPDLVVVMNPIYVEEIGRSLVELGLSPEMHALGAGRVGAFL